jgi:hypothetical protein
MLYKAFYIGNPLLLWPVLSLLLFMAVFVLAAVRAMRLREPHRLNRLTALPLESGEHFQPEEARHG